MIVIHKWLPLSLKFEQCEELGPQSDVQLYRYVSAPNVIPLDIDWILFTVVCTLKKRSGNQNKTKPDICPSVV